MKTTNTLLTIIAACLVFQVAHSFVQKPIPVTVQTQEKAATPNGTLEVDIVSVGGTTLDEVDGRTVLPVGVRNTVDTNIKAVDGSLENSGGDEGLPVVILNH